MGLAPRNRVGVRKTDWPLNGDMDRHISLSNTSALSAYMADEHALLAGIADNLRSGFLLFNESEQLAYANLNARRLLSIESELFGSQSPVFDVRKQLLALAVDPATAQLALDRLWNASEAECFVDVALVDAAVRWLRVQRFPLCDKPGHVLGSGVLLDDVTLERSAIQSRNETLATAAHELKTPLAIIKGSATTLLSNTMRWDPAMQREMLQMVDAQADRLHEILNTLLDVWRLDAGVQNLHFSETRLPELLQALVARWSKNAPHHRFLCDVGQEVAPILCDPARIEQAIHQLLHNAVNSSPPGGAIRLSLEEHEHEIYLSVSDQGKGIASEHLEHIFERFYRVPAADERNPGSGLGLAVARANIEAHGGRIWADSPGPGEGAVFYCVLPFTPPGAQRPAYWQAPAAPPQGASLQTGPLAALPARHASRVRIAVVESDPRIARYLRANLEEQQYRVQVMSRGVQFLRQFDLEEPELVLLANTLEDMQGIELLQHLREFSHVPVMMLCDTDDEDERVHLLDLGADDLVSKPFGMKELLARLRVLLRRQTSPGEQLQGETIFATGDLVIDYTQHQVQLLGQPVQLSRTEYKLLCVLAQNVGRVLTHELLLERVWGAEYNREVDFIWVYISRLRRKIEPDSRHPRYIVTVPDVGYKLVKL
jgi:DNA-binding response OmpR family regulator/signal transduction histidine kinase